MFVTATTDGALSSRVSHLSSTFQTHDCCSGQFCAGVTGQNFASAAPGASHLLPRASARASWEGHRPSLSSPGACASLGGLSALKVRPGLLCTWGAGAVPLGVQCLYLVRGRA